MEDYFLKTTTDRQNNIKSQHHNLDDFDVKSWNDFLKNSKFNLKSNSTYAEMSHEIDTIIIDYNYAIRYWIANEKTDEYYQVIQTLFGFKQKDLRLFIDSTAHGNAFLPDPLTTAEVEYGAPYIDQNDMDVLVLTNEMQNVSFPATFENDTFYLKNNFVEIAEFSAPSIPPVISTTPNFNYTRSQSGFEDVNAFFHINNFRNYLTTINSDSFNFKINVDVHGNGGDDQSFFSPTPFPRLTFGEGGVDDAEDADVLIHEYMHAVSHYVSPFTNAGAERSAIEEATGDYFAVSYSRQFSDFNWHHVFSWDGHNDFWDGRIANTTKTYEDVNITTQSIYENGEIWTAILMDIYNTLGSDISDKLVLQSMYGFFQSMTFIDAANEILLADDLLYGYTHECALKQIFYERKIFDADCFNAIRDFENAETISLLNSVSFTNRKGNALIKNENDSEMQITMFDTNGKLIMQAKTQGESFSIAPENFSKGMYFVHVKTKDGRIIFKLLK